MTYIHTHTITTTRTDRITSHHHNYLPHPPGCITPNPVHTSTLWHELIAKTANRWLLMWKVGCWCFACVVVVMKVPRAEIEPTSLTFQASALPLHHVGFLMSQLCPLLPVYVAVYLRGQCNYYTYSPGIVSLLMLTINYIHTGNNLT